MNRQTRICTGERVSAGPDMMSGPYIAAIKACLAPLPFASLSKSPGQLASC